MAGCSSSGSDTPPPQAPPAAYTPPPPGLRSDNTLSVSGTTRYFDYYVPPALPEDAPVLILLHGGTQNKTRVIDGTSGSSGWLSVAESEAVLLVVPNGTGADGDPNAVSASWNDCRSDQVSGSSADDVAFIAALIDWAANEQSLVVDENRVYVAGASNGGMMSYRAALELGDRIAGIAAFIANNPANLDPSCEAAVNDPDPAPVSVFICNGTADVLMPFNGGTVALGSGGQVTSSLETRDFWRARNSTTRSLPPVVYPNIDPTDNSTVVGADYVGGTGAAAVSWLTVFAGGHTMPSLRFFSPTGAQNRDIESAVVAWEFLQDKRR
ncbi:MAG: PHB depolymerase family esterase [Woeseiaceae bacterium]|nr:PHB depolymerase family esterase [Woeseiaceae bacterium]